MKLSKSTALLLALAATLSLGACDFFEQEDYSFSDNPQLEFYPLSNTVDEGSGPVTPAIQLIGPQRDSDLQVSYAADDSSSAVEGVHYSLDSNQATIEAGSSSTQISVEVLDNDLDDSDTNYILYLSLNDSEGVEAAENLDTYTLTIRGTEEDPDEDE